MFRILFLFLLALSLTTCDHLPRNGWLDGQWQLVSKDGEELKPQRIYWRIQLDLLELYSPTTRLSTDIPYNNVVCRFSHEGDHLHITAAYLVLRSEGRDSLITPEMNVDLTPLGLDKIPVTFKLSSTSSTMTLEHAGHQWRFRRF